MLRLLPLLIAVPFLIGYGIWQGLWTNRWELTNDLDKAVARLDEIPLTFGEWSATDREIDEQSLQKGEVSGYKMRDYVNRRTGETVSVLIVCGHPGPMSLHTPDVCYRGAGYAMTAKQKRHTEKFESLPVPVNLYMGDFQKLNSPLPDQMRIYWTWSANGDWRAPSMPRWDFAGYPALYKLYIIRSTAELDEPVEDDPSMKFLHDFLPHATHALFPDSQQKNN